MTCLAKAFRASPDAIVILTAQEGRFVEANDSFLRQLGYTRQELIGRTTTELRLWGNPQERKALFDTLAAHGSLRDFETSLCTRDGRLIAAQITAETVDLDGKRCVLAVWRDVTDQKRAQEALQNSEERYRVLFEANPQPMWVYQSESLRFLAVNRAAIEHYGYSRKDFLSMTVRDLVAAEEAYRLLEAPSNGTHRVDLWRHRTKDGRLIQVELTTRPLIFEQNQAVLVLANDVTERIVLEDQLRQLQKMEAVGQLAGGIAHDFNNLLNIIDGYAQLLKEQAHPDSRMSFQMDKILSATRRAASLTGQLLAFSRRQAFSPRILNLNELVTDLARMIPRLIGEDIDVRLLQSANLGFIETDRAHLEQVILNLIANARDAMPNGGTLTVETGNFVMDSKYSQARGIALPSGPYVVLTVSDTGRGMDAETQSRIFEPFFTTKEHGKGTGLGLAIVYGIVKQSGGFIEVVSEPGKGSAFKIYLPEVASGMEFADPHQESSSPRAATILVVEDEEDLCDVCCEYLNFKGYTVLRANDGASALQICQTEENSIDLLVTDVVMPHMSGLELAKAAMKIRPGLRVVYVSGYSDRVLDPAIRADSAMFLQKPYNLEALSKTIQKALARQLVAFQTA